MIDSFVLFISFVIVTLVSRTIGHFLGKYHLPHITGYLFAGVLVGPYVLNVLPKGSTEQLVIVEHLSLAVLAFIAGSELSIKELRSRFRAIMINTVGVVVAGIIINSIALFLLMDLMPFASTMPTTSRIAVAVLGSTILLALSPPSTIAVLQEVRAHGTFSKTILSMTVVMDVIVIILFATMSALIGSLIDGSEHLELSFAAHIIMGMLIAVVVGVGIGYVISLILSTHLHPWIKIGTILLMGTSIFIASEEAILISQLLGFNLRIEALLICMITGFYLTNVSDHHRQFEQILHGVSQPVYVAFFTLIGIGLKLDILFNMIGIAFLLFGIRIFSIMVGSYLGGYLAREDRKITKNMWMGLITQAGIALGLAREVASEFPTLGNAFATIIVSVVLLNEICGPLFLKYVLRHVGESHISISPKIVLEDD